MKVIPWRLHPIHQPVMIAIAINATTAMKLSPIPILNPFNADI
jgi:hypothetical protein